MKTEFYDPNGPNGYLANFAITPFFLDGHRWPTVEHYFQAKKFESHPQIARAIRVSPSAATAKRIAKICRGYADPEWKCVRESEMYKAIVAKFSQHGDLAKRLMDTANSEIVEVADDDDYWGIGKSGNGLNRMGVLLMQLRSELRHTVSDCERAG